MDKDISGYVTAAIAAIIVLLFILLLMDDADAARSRNWVSWEERGCLNWADFDYPDKINPALLEKLCTAVSIGNNVFRRNWKVSVHSDGRPISQHTVFNAVDFHLSDYTDGRDAHEVFRLDVDDFGSILRLTGSDAVVGWGLYVKTPNPFFHIDLRSRSARWCRIGPEGTPYVAFGKCLEYIRNRKKI